MTAIKYPRSKKVEQVDDYHGTLVPDLYRWLEDVNSPNTLDWISEQNKLTFSFFENISSRDTIRDRLNELWDYPKASAPQKHGSQFFQMRNSGLQNQDVLYVSEDHAGVWDLLLDIAIAGLLEKRKIQNLAFLI